MSGRSYKNKLFNCIKRFSLPFLRQIGRDLNKIDSNLVAQIAMKFNSFSHPIFHFHFFISLQITF